MGILTKLDRVRSASSAPGKNIRIGVIGGAGRMGSFLLSVFQKAGYRNLCLSDVSGEAGKVADSLGVQIVENNTALAEQCDMTIVSVLPMDSTPKVIDEVGPSIKENALLMHQTSIQSPGAEAMKNFPRCSHMGIHIMSQPGANLSLKNTNVVLIPEKEDDVWTDRIKQIFFKTKAKLYLADAASHDKLLALIHGQGHLSVLLAGYVMATACGQFGITMDQLSQIQTQGFLLGMLNLGRMVSSNNPQIYSDIQSHNPYTAQVRELFREGLDYFCSATESGELDPFRRAFEQMTAFYGIDRANWAKQASDDLISTMNPYPGDTKF
ncbi:MAG: prephenate dehydrogenase/arogenate dehydrogenase family protein [Candidatus Margulisiibacteriota bacterium]